MSCGFLIAAFTACAFSCVAAHPFSCRFGKGCLDQNFSAGGMAVNIKGKGGKFQVYRKNVGENDANKVEVYIEALFELDANGKILGKTANSTSAVHSINSFASQDFEFLPLAMPGHPGDPRGVVYVGFDPDVKASMTSFTSTVGTSSIYAGKIQVDTFVVHQKGFVGPDDDALWEVVPGDMKFNIVLRDWTWCGDRRGGKVECGTDVGKFIDVGVVIKGMDFRRESWGPMPKRKPEPSKGRAGKGKKSDFAMGGGIDLRLTNLVEIYPCATCKGTLIEMPAGYPKTFFMGDVPRFVFRFPRFAKGAIAVYDPLLTSGAASVEGLASQAAGLSVLPIVSVIFAVLASKLLF